MFLCWRFLHAVGIGMCMYNSKIQYSLLNLRCNSSLMLGVQWCFHSQLVRLDQVKYRKYGAR